MSASLHGFSSKSRRQSNLVLSGLGTTGLAPSLPTQWSTIRSESPATLAVGTRDRYSNQGADSTPIRVELPHTSIDSLLTTAFSDARLYQQLLRIAHRYGANHEDATDLLQSVAQELLLSRSSIRTIGQLKTVIARRGIDALRRRSVSRNVLQTMTDSEDLQGEPTATASSKDCQSAVEAMITLQWVQKQPVWRQMSPKFQRMLELYSDLRVDRTRAEGAMFSAIARQLNHEFGTTHSAGYVKEYLKRIRKRLVTML